MPPASFGRPQPAPVRRAGCGGPGCGCDYLLLSSLQVWFQVGSGQLMLVFTTTGTTGGSTNTGAARTAWGPKQNGKATVPNRQDDPATTTPFPQTKPAVVRKHEAGATLVTTAPLTVTEVVAVDEKPYTSVTVRESAYTPGTE